MVVLPALVNISKGAYGTSVATRTDPADLIAAGRASCSDGSGLIVTPAMVTEAGAAALPLLQPVSATAASAVAPMTARVVRRSDRITMCPSTRLSPLLCALQ